MLNSLYGKFGKNIYIGGKYPVYDPIEDKIVYEEIPPKRHENGELVLAKGEYMPIAIFVTAYARVKMIRSAQANYDRFIYCDTDSNHLVGTEPPKGIEIDPYKLGAWKEEDIFIRARYLRPKAYIMEVVKKDGSQEVKVTCSGMTDPIKEQVSFDNFYIGLQLKGKKRPRDIRGGTIFDDGTFTLLG